jgi:hypothetical protein
MRFRSAPVGIGLAVMLGLVAPGRLDASDPAPGASDERGNGRTSAAKCEWTWERQPRSCASRPPAGIRFVRT